MSHAATMSFDEHHVRTIAQTTMHAHIERRAERAMQNVFDHLELAAARLARAEQPVRVRYPVPGMKTVLEAVQTDHEVSRSDDGDQVIFSFIYRIPDISRIPVLGDTARDAGLREVGGGVLRFRSVASRSPGAPFRVEAYIPVQIRFQVDHERGVVVLAISNLDGPGQEMHRFSPDAVSHGLMLELCKRIEGRANEFTSYTQFRVSDELRARLRAQIAEAAVRKERLMESPLRRTARRLRGWLRPQGGRTASVRRAS